MAPTGTRIPNEAGIQNVIPSKPRPDQLEEHPQFDNEGLGQPDIVNAADNDIDMPRSTRDTAVTAAAGADIVTGTGDSLPAEIATQHLQILADDPGARGNTREIKHAVLNRGVFDRLVAEERGEWVNRQEEADSKGREKVRACN
jgi:hypothetical protein